MHYTRALARLPGPNFAGGLSQYANEGSPDLARTLQQHAAYVAALETAGVRVTLLPADAEHPDGTFVEDTAVVTPEWAILTRPGAPSRVGEIGAVGEALRGVLPSAGEIVPPGTVDGGDICEAGRHYFIGLSQRTNPAGAAQLATLLAARGCTSSVIDIRGSATLLHLKSGIAYLGDGRLAVTADLPPASELSRFELIRVPPAESYAANCIRINEVVFVASGYPVFHNLLRAHGYSLIELDVSEFRKMDGGLSCLSLRY